MTDQEVLLLSSAIRHCSMERLVLNWSCTDPGNTLKEIGESVRRSKLRELRLKLQSQVKPNEKEVREWAVCVEIGGKDLIQSQENSLLQILTLNIYCINCDIKPILGHVRQTLEVTAAAVNTARQQKGLNHIHFFINQY